MATIITVSIADTNSTSSATMVVAATTSATSRRVSPSARARASSLDAYRVSTSITRTTSAALIRASKTQSTTRSGSNKKMGKNETFVTRTPRVTHTTIAGQAAN
jgi:hypothetical protein